MQRRNYTGFIRVSCVQLVMLFCFESKDCKNKEKKTTQSTLLNKAVCATIKKKKVQNLKVN